MRHVSMVASMMKYQDGIEASVSLPKPNTSKDHSLYANAFNKGMMFSLRLILNRSDGTCEGGAVTSSSP